MLIVSTTFYLQYPMGSPYTLLEQKFRPNLMNFEKLKFTVDLGEITEDLVKITPNCLTTRLIKCFIRTYFRCKIILLNIMPREVRMP